MPLLRVCNPRAELGQRHPAIPVPGAVHAVHDAPASRSGRTSVSDPAHPGSRLLLDTGDTTPYRTENAVPAGKPGGGVCRSRTTPILGLRPLNPGSAPKGDNLSAETQRACGWRSALQLAGVGEGPMTIQVQPSTLAPPLNPAHVPSLT